MLSRSSLTGIIPLFLLSLACCGRREPPICAEIFRLPFRERPAAIRRLSPEDQVDAFLCGVRRDPPDLGLAEALADGGKPVAEAVLARLSVVESDYEGFHLIQALEGLAKRSPQLSKEMGFPDRIRSAIDKMVVADWRRRSLATLARLNEGD